MSQNQYKNVTHCIFDMDGLLLSKWFILSYLYYIYIQWINIYREGLFN